MKLTDMKTETSTSTNSTSTAVTKYKASHILFPLDINYYLDKKAREAKFKLYLKIENPLKAILNPSTSTQK